MNCAQLIHLIAHRGNARDFPENTLPAFASALALGLRHIELDVHLSSDGVPVVIHDHALQRTTGLSATVFELTAQQLTRLDAHEPARFGTRFRGTAIALLSQVLTLLEGTAEVTLFVEIKRASLARFGQQAVIERVLQVLERARTRCVLISFDLPALVRARQQSSLAIGWVLGQYDPDSRRRCEAVEPEFVFCDLDQLPADDPPWRGPWRWAVYEVESMPIALSLAERGVHYIETMAVQPMSAALAIARSAPTDRPTDA